MKLLHICRNYATTKVFVQLFSRLADRGIEQRVYVPELYASNEGRNLPENQRFAVRYSLILRRWDSFLYYTKIRRAVPDAERLFELNDATPRGVDLIHAHTLFTDGGIAYGLHRRHGIPFVVSVRFTDLEYFFKYMPHLRGQAMQILSAARRVVFLSPASRRRMFDLYVPESLHAALWQKSEVIPNGIDQQWAQGASPRSWQPGQPLRVAFAGNLEKRKQPLFAAEVAQALQSMMPDTPVSLEIAGSGPLEQALRAHSLAKSGALVLRGQLDGIQAMLNFYDGCHLFLLPSRAESFGLVYLEAMSRGLPVLYTRGQGFDGQFDEGAAGFAIDPDDARSAALAACAALDGYADRSARCIELAAMLHWEPVADKMAALYASCPSGRKEP